MPTFLVFKDGKVVDEVMGANKDLLLLMIQKAAAGGPYN